MNATCERCGPSVRALVTFLTEDDEWSFCGHHAAQYEPALLARGFERYELALPDVREARAGSVAG